MLRKKKKKKKCFDASVTTKTADELFVPIYHFIFLSSVSIDRRTREEDFALADRPAERRLSVFLRRGAEGARFSFDYSLASPPPYSKFFSHVLSPFQFYAARVSVV